MYMQQKQMANEIVGRHGGVRENHSRGCVAWGGGTLGDSESYGIATGLYIFGNLATEMQFARKDEDW